MMSAGEKFSLWCIGFMIFLFLFGFVIAKPQFNVSAKGPYYLNEDNNYTHNFTANLSTSEPPQTFSISGINWSENSSETNFSWITLTDVSQGLVFFNSSTDNETGRFNITMSVINDSGSGDVETFFFEVNATNDEPNFTNIEVEYNLTQNVNFYDFLNATDEEEHYPLFFNITFNGSCSHASWSGRAEDANCSLFDFGFNLTDVPNLSASMNFTPAKNDVGVYYANISVMDSGENYTCPHIYCDNSSYESNKTNYYSQIVKFNVLDNLEINVSDCQDRVFQENQESLCEINITTQGISNNINVSSLAILRNAAGDSVSNLSWFYAENVTTSANFSRTIYINTTPQKTEIGNWTINFTVQDTTAEQNSTEQIYIHVNRTANDVPDLTSLSNVDASIDLQTIINLTVYDDDLLIPDKNNLLGGFNETTTFNVTIFNQSNLGQTLNLTNFTITILSMPISDSNITNAEIKFTANSTDIGNYTINITVNDSENALDSEEFNLSILANGFPEWNQSDGYEFLLTVNSTFATTSSFGPINLSDTYTTDPDAGDVLTFTNASGAPPSFNLSSIGIIVFTPYKQDVGFWSFSVTATDPLGLANTTTFNFNISNINSFPGIDTPITVNVNATVDSDSNVNTSEDNATRITLFIEDDDFIVDSSQKTYYNENLTFNVTIQGPNTNLFNFSAFAGWPVPGSNRSRYDADFTPNKSDVGDYNITINVSDIANASDFVEFNLSIVEVAHNPVLMNLTNQSSGINRSLFYDINATDVEDINETSGNLTYSYVFWSDGKTDDFINNNETIFNTTSGVLNITFNDSQEGHYHLNITVNDSAGSEDVGEFFIDVYGFPNVTYPSADFNFSFQENVSKESNFTANHSVGNNLTYEFYINGVLRNSTNYYGNSTNITWLFLPNFTDETYGNFQNLTLILYPNSSELVNATEFNLTQNWNVNITHSNAPISFNGTISGQQKNYDQDITVNLTQYFLDVDYSDKNYNQTLSFTVASNASPSSITSSVSSDYILTLSASSVLKETLNVTGFDLNSTDNSSFTNATSNNFEIEFTEPTTTESSGGTSSGGSQSVKPVLLKIIVPDPVSAYKQDRIVLPITLSNDGEVSLSGITLTSEVVKDGILRGDIATSFDTSFFSNLNIGSKKNVTLTIDVNTDEVGTFEILINASVTNPKYTDFAKLFLTIKEGTIIEEKILFTEEFLADNPECLELREILEEAKVHVREGRFDLADKKSEEAIDACKEAISQAQKPRLRELVENKLYRNLIIATIFAFFTGISYYSYRRMKLRRNTYNGFSKHKKIIEIKESVK